MEQLLKAVSDALSKKPESERRLYLAAVTQLLNFDDCRTDMRAFFNEISVGPLADKVEDIPEKSLLPDDPVVIFIGGWAAALRAVDQLLEIH